VWLEIGNHSEQTGFLKERMWELLKTPTLSGSILSFKNRKRVSIFLNKKWSTYFRVRHSLLH